MPRQVDDLFGGQVANQVGALVRGAYMGWFHRALAPGGGLPGREAGSVAGEGADGYVVFADEAGQVAIRKIFNSTV